ncbi:MAG: cytochrome c maturation protein CcmE [Candidatus Marinimicrobia bacterium]|nr:cytochrome c maturation protein CcmE [Candidatus Neomarinimicrobiota bacterium]
MNKKFTVVIVAVVLLLVFWVATGIEGNELPYATIGELENYQGKLDGKRFRLGGNVQEGSIVRDKTNPLFVGFIIEQGDETLPVNYHKITPDMFKDGVEVIVEGEFVNGTFQADNLMTKCASRYEGDLRQTQMNEIEL